MSLLVYKKVCRKIRNKFIKILVQLEINFIRSLPNLDSVVVFCVSVAKMSLHAVIKRPANKAIDHFTVVCLVTWPLSGSQAGVDLVLMQTLLLFICTYKLVSMTTT